MRWAKAVGNVFLLIYLWISLNAFLYTVIRHPVFTLFPHTLIAYSYGMMAPYQAAVSWHTAIYAECERSGMWHPVDLAPYMPMMFGERNTREYFAMYPYFEENTDIYRRKFAERLQALEQQKGNMCDQVRLSWDRWPPMTGSYELLRLPAFTQRTPLYGF